MLYLISVWKRKGSTRVYHLIRKKCQKYKKNYVSISVGQHIFTGCWFHIGLFTKCCDPNSFRYSLGIPKYQGQWFEIKLWDHSNCLPLLPALSQGSIKYQAMKRGMRFLNSHALLNIIHMLKNVLLNFMLLYFLKFYFPFFQTSSLFSLLISL